MKKRLSVIVLMLFCTFLCSCTSNYSKDVHFVHAVCFDKNIENGKSEIYAVMEKQTADDTNKKKEQSYFTATKSGNNFQEALNKLTNEYSGSYYASNTVYFFPDNIAIETLYDIGVFLSQSNILPSKAMAVYICEVTPYDFLDQINNQDDIKEILKLTHNKKINVIHFLSGCKTEQTEKKLPQLTLDGRDKNFTFVTKTKKE